MPPSLPSTVPWNFNAVTTSTQPWIKRSWPFSSLLVNGLLQVVLQPLGLGIDANLPVVLQLCTAGGADE